MDVAVWLRALDLERYGQTFLDHGIDGEVLPDLTDADLEKIGVLLGHRKKILKAIAQLRGSGSLSTELGEPLVVAAIRPQAERRQITALFCDLVGSTALGSRIDPEDFHELMSAYHTCVVEAVQPFGGCVAKYFGDGDLVYFGYPDAHEDDAEQAIRAALEVVSAMRAIGAGPEQLKVRVGIATGVVIVGDLFPSEVRERQIVGEPLNIAARLQALAAPGCVVIADSTRKLVGALFEVRDLGPKSLKGIPEQLRVWQVLGPSVTESRFDALHAGGLTPLVGRDEHIKEILRRWEQAQSGDGQVVLLGGEAGIGKSRISASVVNHITEPHTTLRFFCSPSRANSALYPFINQLESAARFDRKDSSHAKVRKLHTLLAANAASPEDRAAVVELLSLPNSNRYPWLDFPRQRKQKTFDALLRQLEALSRDRPVLAIFEDLQWADPTSIELLSRIIEGIRPMRVLAIISFRPDFAPPWSGRPQVTLLMLNRLEPQDAQAMVEWIARSEALPMDVRQEIVERTDGVPLFIEELTKAILEAGPVELRARVALSSGASLVRSIPATLHASLMARLDRLGSAKQVVQIGAAIGRQFAYELLAGVSRLTETELQHGLNRLVQAGLLFRSEEDLNGQYLFKHALIQEEAYNTLLRGRRQELHARIVEVLEEKFQATCEAEPELLAHHCTEGAAIAKAIQYWRKAGQQSISRSALTEAVTQLKRGLELAARAELTSELRSEQLVLQVALASTLVHIQGYASPDVIAAFEDARLMVERARSLGEQTTDSLLQFSVMYGLWVTNYVAINTNRMYERAKGFLDLAEGQQSSAPKLVGHRIMGTSLFMQGRFDEALIHLNRAVAMYQPEQHRGLTARFSQDIGISALSFRSWTLWHLGYPDAAAKDAKELLARARDLGEVTTLTYALFHVVIPEVLSGRVTEAEVKLDELMSLTERYGLFFWKSLGLFLQGWCLYLSGRASDAARTLNAAFAMYSTTGSTLFTPVFLGILAGAYDQEGRMKESFEAISEGLLAVERTNERWGEAELYRLLGELRLSSPGADHKKAEQYLQKSMAIARRQHAKSYELRTANTMARYYLKCDNRTKARDALAPVFGWFSEGSGTRDLEDANALLRLLQ
jgi:class 3 adenylate cyclase/predicted ATPase